MQRRKYAVALAIISVVLLVTSLLALSEWTLPSTQAQGSDPIEVRANQVTTADQQEPTLAVDPTNPNNVLAASKDWRTGPKQVWYYHSTDGGHTWADGHVPFQDALPNQSDPVLTFNANGVAYLSVIAYNQSDLTVGGIYVARSRDGGTTWDKPVLVAAHNDTVFNDKEWIAVDRSNSQTKGNIYVSWTLFTTLTPTKERGDIAVSRSTDGGQTFSDHVGASLPSQQNTQGSFPVVGPSGQLYVLYYSENGNPTEEEDAGAKVQTQSEDKLAQASGSALYIATSTDGGQSFAPARKVADVVRPPSPLPGSAFRMFVLPALAVDHKSGALYATWNDYAARESDVMLTSSTDGGLNWSAPAKVNDDQASQARHDHFFPTAIVGADNTLHLLWLDRRDSPDNKLYLPYYARSTDGGKTFSQDQALSRTPSNPDVGFEGTLMGDYVSIDASNDGSRVFMTWPDTRNGDQDIYFSAFSAKDGPPSPGPEAQAHPTPVAVPSPQPLTGFNNDAFRHKWDAADIPVLRGKENRSWLWGPSAFAAADEPYKQGTQGKREVLYFDKARMEVNNPSADPTSPTYVTNGLLVVEMVSGRIQTGDNQFEPPRAPSQAVIAGDSNSSDAITYASLAPVASLNGDKQAPDKTGRSTAEVLDRSGQVRLDQGRQPVKLVRFEPATGHNIADVFWTFMNSSGPIFNDRFNTYSNGAILNWVSDLGYPITDPYWTNVVIGGSGKWVLIQAFQRRVLTYVPDNQPGWQVEMGNVGRHYYDWRYLGK